MKMMAKIMMKMMTNHDENDEWTNNDDDDPGPNCDLPPVSGRPGA